MGNIFEGLFSLLNTYFPIQYMFDLLKTIFPNMSIEHYQDITQVGEACFFFSLYFVFIALILVLVFTLFKYIYIFVKNLFWRL